MKTWLMEGSAYAEDGRTWYTGDKINADDIEVVMADLAQSLADALESIAKNTCCEGCQEAAKVAQAALANYRKGENAPAIEKARGG